jgi:sterol desaturase/sphingolipid hydroxylase (fatty acid hydroxylase superfamily)
VTETEQSFVSLVQQTRYGVAAVALAAFWMIESIAPMFAGRSRRGSHVAANLGLAAINALVAALFAVLIIAVAEWTRTREFGLLNVISPPVWVQWVAAIVLFDCWQYWWHRLNHRIPFLWRFHSVHHADAELDVSSGVRFHTGEMALSFMARLLVIPLLGITLPQLAIYEAISLPVILFHHSNLRLSGRADRCLRWLIVTPWMHFVHHSRWQPETDSNYSSLLSVWDRIFGSFRLREKPEEILLGLDGWQEREWRGLPGMLAKPFRKARPRANVDPPSANTSTPNPAALSK